MFFRIAVLKHFAMFTGKHPCWKHLYRAECLQLYLKEAPKQVFYREYCQIFKNSYSGTEVLKARKKKYLNNTHGCFSGVFIVTFVKYLLLHISMNIDKSHVFLFNLHSFSQRANNSSKSALKRLEQCPWIFF